MTKALVRTNMKNLRNSFEEEELMAQSSAIHKKLFQLTQYQHCDGIFTYISFQSEVDTKVIIDKAKDNKKIYVPKVEGNIINFYRISSMNSLLVSPYGILEPEGIIHNRYQNYDEKLDKKIMLLPGLAFDLSGNRIGYGAGYYDRYLSTYSDNEFIKIALAFDFQVVKDITTEEYDKKVDMIITPKRIINCKEYR